MICLPYQCFPAPLLRRGRIAPRPALAERSSRRHLLSLPRGRGPSQTPKFLSPGPPSPWLPALIMGKILCQFCGEPSIPGAGFLYGRGCKCRRRFNAGVPGAKPPAKSTKNLPLPRRGRGRGDGGKRERSRRGRRAAKQASPPADSGKAESSGDHPGKLPAGYLPAGSANAARVQSRGCKGLSPLHKKTKKSPPSPEGKSALRARAGGWGRKSYDTAGKADAAGHSAPRRATAAAG